VSATKANEKSVGVGNITSLDRRRILWSRPKLYMHQPPRCSSDRRCRGFPRHPAGRAMSPLPHNGQHRWSTSRKYPFYRLRTGLLSAHDCRGTCSRFHPACFASWRRIDIPTVSTWSPKDTAHGVNGTSQRGRLTQCSNFQRGSFRKCKKLGSTLRPAV